MAFRKIILLLTMGFYFQPQLNVKASENCEPGFEENILEIFSKTSWKDVNFTEDMILTCSPDSASLCNAEGDVLHQTTSPDDAKQIHEAIKEKLIKNEIIVPEQIPNEFLIRPEVLEEKKEKKEESAEPESRFVFFFDGMADEVVRYDTLTKERVAASAPVGENLGYHDFTPDGQKFVVYDKETGEVEKEYRIDELFSKPEAETEINRPKEAPKTSNSRFEILLPSELPDRLVNPQTEARLPGFFVIDHDQSRVLFPKDLEAQIEIKFKSGDSSQNSNDKTNSVRKSDATPSEGFSVDPTGQYAYRVIRRGNKTYLQKYALGASVLSANKLTSDFRGDSFSFSIPQAADQLTLGSTDSHLPGSLVVDGTDFSSAQLAAAFDAVLSSNEAAPLSDVQLSQFSKDFLEKDSEAIEAKISEVEVSILAPDQTESKTDAKSSKVDQAFSSLIPRRSAAKTSQDTLEILVRRLEPSRLPVESAANHLNQTQRAKQTSEQRRIELDDAKSKPTSSEESSSPYPPLLATLNRNPYQMKKALQQS